MLKNFFDGTTALTREMRLFLVSLAYEPALIGFVAGAIITILIIAFVLTKNPLHIPLILRYSSAECFEKIASRSKSGTYQIAFTAFLKTYTEVRTLFLMSFISFTVLIITVLLVKN